MTRLGLAAYLALALTFLVALVSAKVRVRVSYFWKFSYLYVDGYWDQPVNRQYKRVLLI